MRISKLGLAALVAACTIAVVYPAPAQARQRAGAIALDAASRLAMFEQVWTAVRDYYYDPRFNGADWNGIRARFRPLAADAADDSAFYRLMRAMLGELRDAHTRLLDPRQARERQAEQRLSAGVILFEVEGQPLVFDVVPASPASEAGLRPGQRLLAVNGIAIDEALRSSLAEVGSSSSDRAARLLAYLRLTAGAAAEPLRLRLAEPGGAAFDVVLQRRLLPIAPRFESRLLPSGDLYVRFDRFRKPVSDRLRAVLSANRDAPGLILDLRSNPGGDGKEGARAIGPLLAEPVLVARLATRTGKPPSALAGLVTLPLELKAGRAGGQIYSGPIVILINAGTASTAEVIAGSLQERGRASVVGSRSCGCALGVLKYRKLPGGAALAISEVGLLSGLGHRIEGAGVTPDVEVAMKLADLAGGSDSALDRAVVQLRAMQPGR
jgi:carboxyl-terminal processing protease